VVTEIDTLIVYDSLGT